MRQLQRFFAAALLVFTLAFSTAAHDGIIHTGCTEPVPPPPATGSSVAAEEPAGDVTVEGETTAVDAVVEAALACLSNVLALY